MVKVQVITWSPDCGCSFDMHVVLREELEPEVSMHACHKKCSIHNNLEDLAAFDAAMLLCVENGGSNG